MPITIGGKLNRQGAVVGGKSVEQWAAENGGRDARLIVVEVVSEQGVAPTTVSTEQRDGNPDVASGDRGGGSERRYTGPSGDSSQGENQGRYVAGGRTAEDSHDGRTTRVEGKEQHGQDVGGETGTRRGRYTGDTGGSTSGRGHTAKKAGYFHDPRRKGTGGNDLAPPNSDSEGTAGGEGEKRDRGAPGGSGYLNLVELPANVGPMVAVGMLLADADITGLSDNLIKKARVLSKGGKATRALKEAVEKDLKELIDREIEKVARELESAPEFAGKSAAEKAAHLKETRGALEEVAHGKVLARVNQQVKEAERIAAEAKQHPGKYSNDVIKEAEEAAEAGRAAREALSAKAPTSFRNKFPKDKVVLPRQIIKPEHLRLKNGRFNYVVTADGKLIVGRQVPNGPGGGHIDLAGGDKVLAAGEVQIVEGKIRYMDNSSGHYLPVGDHARQAAEKAFLDGGFDVAGKYVEKAWSQEKMKWLPIK